MRDGGESPLRLSGRHASAPPTPLGLAARSHHGVLDLQGGAYLLYEKASEAGVGQTLDFAPASEALTGE